MSRLGTLTRSAIASAALAFLCASVSADTFSGSWNPASRPGYWCGTGLVPLGHSLREIRSKDGALDLALTVRQADDQLCYVEGGNAEAPLLRLRQGDKLTVTLRNEISDPSLIDTFVPAGYVEAPNEAIAGKPEFYPIEPGMRHEATGATNLHMHGFPVPPVAPQDEVLKTCADPAMGPQNCGARQITYSYTLPETMPAGAYWYHPHVHGEVQPQILMGLSGPIVVEGPADDARRAAGIEDRVLMVRQLADTDAPRSIFPPSGFTKDNHHHDMPATSTAGDTFSKRRIDTVDEAACGQALPELLSLNGARVTGGRPLDQDIAAFPMAAGRKELWRVINGATDFYLNLVVVDERGLVQPIEVVSWDGVPQADDHGNLLSLPSSKDPQLVAPGGRVEFLVSAPPRGRMFYLVSRNVDTGCAGDANPERWLARIVAVDPPQAATSTGTRSASNSALPENLPICTAPAPVKVSTRRSAIGMFEGLLDGKPSVRRTLAFTEYPRPGFEDQIDFYLTELKPGAVMRPYHMGGPPNFTVQADTLEEWTIENWTRELHAFHAHQVHFRVVESDGKALANPPLRDVVNVPFATPVDPKKPNGELRPGRVKIRIAFPRELAGDIPIHCHLVDHEDAGMMAVVRVVP